MGEGGWRVQFLRRCLEQLTDREELQLIRAEVNLRERVRVDRWIE